MLINSQYIHANGSSQKSWVKTVLGFYFIFKRHYCTSDNSQYVVAVFKYVYLLFNVFSFLSVTDADDLKTSFYGSSIC